MSADNERKCECCGDMTENAVRDYHKRYVCETCWEEMVEWVCSRCNYEFRAMDNDCCPDCCHHPEDPVCPCGCKEEDGEEQTCDECGDHREGSEGHWECVEDAEGDERVLCDACYEKAGRPNDE
jgi:hypothetical protein